MAFKIAFDGIPAIVANHGPSFSLDVSRAQLHAAETAALLFVQADGHELEHIQTRFANLPYSHRVCTWRGEMARFILDNLNG